MAIIAMLDPIDIWSKLGQKEQMRNFSARDAKNQFGLLIDTARVNPVVIEKHGRPVVVVCSVEEFERLQLLASIGSDPKSTGDE